MNLVIAEKPSVAQSIAKMIGAWKRHDGYLEGCSKSTGNVFEWYTIRGLRVLLRNPPVYVNPPRFA